MTDSVTTPRPYRSALRAAQAEATRTNVLDAAAALFVREGYLGTTMKGIAAEAGTSVETVYAQGAKKTLLLACVDRALTGDDDDARLTDRPDFAASLAQPSAAIVITTFVQALVLVADRASGLIVAFEDAAAADPSISELWAAAEEHRKADYRRMVRAVADLGPLPSGWDVESATDAMWLTATPRNAHIALHTLGWSSERLTDCVTRQLRALLLSPDDRNPS